MNKKEEIITEVKRFHDKYESLVKYSRITPKQTLEHKGLEDFMIEVEKKYPEEIEEMCSKNHDYEIGFNSGMLAACRYILSLNDVDKDFADRHFPFLDT
jgi:hypothetical protein